MAIDDLPTPNSSQHTSQAKTSAPIALQTTSYNSPEQLQNFQRSSTLCPSTWQNVRPTMEPSSNKTPHRDPSTKDQVNCVTQMIQAPQPPPKPPDGRCINCATSCPNNKPSHKIPYHCVVNAAIVDNSAFQLGSPLIPSNRQRPQILSSDQKLRTFE